MDTTEFIIKQDGSAVRRRVIETQLRITEEFNRRVASGATVIVKDVFRIGKFGANLATQSGKFYWTIRQEKLQIRCPWRPVTIPSDKKGDFEYKILVPNFSSKQSDPVLTMEWVPPSDMQVVLVVSVGRDEPGRISTIAVHLFAIGRDEPAFHRLPLANLHPDSRVCTGSASPNALRSHEGLILEEIERFQNSQYNADLWNTVEQSQKMFQFEPNNGKGFNQINPINWPDLCHRLVVNWSNLIII